MHVPLPQRTFLSTYFICPCRGRRHLRVVGTLCGSLHASVCSHLQATGLLCVLTLDVGVSMSVNVLVQGGPECSAWRDVCGCTAAHSWMQVREPAVCAPKHSPHLPLLPYSRLFFFYFFIHERPRGGRDTGRGRSRLHAGSPMWDTIPGPRDHTEPKTGAQPLSHPGVPEIKSYLLEVCLKVSLDWFIGHMFLTRQAHLRFNTEGFSLKGKCVFKITPPLGNQLIWQSKFHGSRPLPIKKSSANGTR